MQQSHSAAANETDVAATTSTAIAVPGGSGTRSTAAAASGGNVVAIHTTATEKDTTTRVTIDEDPRAKLMFYLDCISCVFGDFYTLCMEIINEQSISNIECLLEYKNYRALTVKQCDEILILCDALRPSLFNNKCIFANAQKCGNLTNRFFKMEEVEKSLAIQNEIIVRGERRQVKKIIFRKELFQAYAMFGISLESHYKRTRFRFRNVYRKLQGSPVVNYYFSVLGRCLGRHVFTRG